MPPTLRATWRREAVTYARSWPAPVAAQGQQLLPLLSAQPNVGPERRGVATRLSALAPVAYDVLAIAPQITLDMQLRYAGLEQVWACALGMMAPTLGGVAMPQVVAAGVFRHLYELAPALSAEPWTVGEGWRLGTGLVVGQRKIRRATLAIDMGSEIWEWLSTMVRAWTLAADQGGVTLTLECVSHSVSYASAVNTLATVRACVPNSAPRASLPELTFRIAPWSAVTPLGSGDALQTPTWALRVEQQLAATFGRRTGLAPEEYERTQAPTVTLTFVVPRHANTAWATRWAAGTRVMADAQWAGPLIPGTATPYACRVYLPALEVSNAQTTMTAGIATETVQCLGVIPASAAAGFPLMHRLGPLAVECVTSVSQHPLL